MGRPPKNDKAKPDQDGQQEEKKADEITVTDKTLAGENEELRKEMNEIKSQLHLFIKKYNQRETEVHTGELGKTNPLPIMEVGDPGPVEKVSESEFVRFAELERFMNDILTIVVAQTTEEGSLDIITPAVNGMNQPIIRGVECKVKRKYVEALARTRTTKWIQKTPDPTKPENIQMEDRTSVTYPFSAIHDPDPRGREWLKAIIAQP